MKTYNLFENVIKSKNFKLDDMKAKIEKSYIKGDITEEEENALLSLALANVNTEAERPEWIEIAETLSGRITALEERVKTLEGEEETTPEETPKHEKWTAWDGISDKYQLGAIVEHNGMIYESTYNGQNVWEPGTQGTELLWKIYEREGT